MAHLLVRVPKGSPAFRAGVKPGDLLVKIDGHDIIDVIDYQYFVSHENPVLTLIRDGRQFDLRVLKRSGDSLGIYFDDMLMDKTRTCANNCAFCFIDQMPPGLRDTLYVKDDDWRLSLLTGNYVTLTNVGEREIDRIIERGVSPLYISVHATDGEVRARIMNNKNAAKIMERLKRLSEGNIAFHAQIVLCPTLNDGEVLKKTLSDLTSFENCLSIAIVPVGMTAFRDNLFKLTPFTEETARQALDICKNANDSRIYVSDEMYIKANLPLPDCESYGDFPQIENGVGMLRLFEKEYLEARKSIKRIYKRNCAVLTGVSASDFIKDMLSNFPIPGVNVRIHAVENTFFGKTITVTGLLTGQDLLKAALSVPEQEILISRCTMKAEEEIFLDGMTLEELKERSGKNITVSPNDGAGFCAAIAGEHTDKVDIWQDL